MVMRCMQEKWIAQRLIWDELEKNESIIRNIRELRCRDTRRVYARHLSGDETSMSALFQIKVAYNMEFVKIRARQTEILGRLDMEWEDRYMNMVYGSILFKSEQFSTCCDNCPEGVWRHMMWEAVIDIRHFVAEATRKSLEGGVSCDSVYHVTRNNANIF